MIVPRDYHACHIRILVPGAALPNLCIEVSQGTTANAWGHYGNAGTSVGQRGKQQHLSDIEQITTIKFFGPNYLIDAVIRYFFWSKGAVKERAKTL